MIFRESPEIKSKKAEDEVDVEEEESARDLIALPFKLPAMKKACRRDPSQD